MYDTFWWMEASEMAKRRNELYGAEWVRKNAVKAGMANKKKRRGKSSHSATLPKSNN